MVWLSGVFLGKQTKICKRREYVATIKVKNKGSQIFIGKKLCLNGKVTPVDEKDLEAFCKTPGGAALIDVSLFVYSDDFKKQKHASTIALKQKAEAEVRQELTPVLKKEIEANLERKYGKRIDDLKKNIDSLEALVAELKKDAKSSDTDTKTDDEKEFVFDPENHVIEHKGGGRYYIFDLEDKKVLDRAITKEEKEKFEAMQKAE